MSIFSLLISLIVMLAGLILLIFNKQIGLYFFLNSPNWYRNSLIWNERVHILLIETILTFLGGVFLIGLVTGK